MLSSLVLPFDFSNFSTIESRNNKEKNRKPKTIIVAIYGFPIFLHSLGLSTERKRNCFLATSGEIAPRRAIESRISIRRISEKGQNRFALFRTTTFLLPIEPSLWLELWKRTNERGGPDTVENEIEGFERARRFTHQPQKLSFAFLAAIRFKHGQTFRFRSHRLVQEDWIALKLGTLELEGRSALPDAMKK